ARKLADDLKGSVRRDWILSTLTIRQAQTGKVKEALQALDDIDDPVQKSLARGSIAVAQVRAGDLAACRRSLDSLPDPCWTLLSVAAVRLEAGAREEAADFYREAIRTVKTPEALWEADGHLCQAPGHLFRILSTWAEAGDEKNALLWADKEKSAFVRAVALAGIAEGIGKRTARGKQPDKGK